MRLKGRSQLNARPWIYFCWLSFWLNPWLLLPISIGPSQSPDSYPTHGANLGRALCPEPEANGLSGHVFFLTRDHDGLLHNSCCGYTWPPNAFRVLSPKVWEWFSGDSGPLRESAPPKPFPQTQSRTCKRIPPINLLKPNKVCAVEMTSAMWRNPGIPWLWKLGVWGYSPTFLWKLNWHSKKSKRPWDF